MRNKIERTFHFDSLWLPFVLLGIALLAKPYFSKESVRFDEEHTINESDRATNEHLDRVNPERVPASKKQQQKFLPKQKSVKTLSKTISTSSAETVELSILKEIDDLENEAFRESEFLKKKVGLSEIQIQAMSLKRKIFLDDLKKIAEMEHLKIPDATEYKQSVIRKHLRWMNQFLGSENYQEYLSMTSSDKT